MADMENSFLEGNGIIILILFILMFGWGGNGFGMGNAAQGALTRAEMYEGFNTAEVQRNQADIKEGICGLNNQIMQSRYDASLMGCDLKTAIHAEGEATRAMIQQQTIEDLKSQLNTAVNAAANSVQTQNILTALGRFVPYGYYNTGCGCGCA